MGRPAPRSHRTLALRTITEALETFLGKSGGKEQTLLTRLWEHWDMVMGEDLADLAMPLGHKRDVLILAAEDSMAAQDIAMRADEVLERVNAFMTGPVFSRIQVELVMGRRDLSRPAPVIRPAPPVYSAPRPANLGSLRGALDPDSPVTRCYEAYLRYFARQK